MPAPVSGQGTYRGQVEKKPYRQSKKNTEKAHTCEQKQRHWE